MSRKNEGLTAANRMVLEGSEALDGPDRVVIAEMANEEKDLLKIRTQEATKRGQVGRTISRYLTEHFAAGVVFRASDRELSERKKRRRTSKK